MMKLNYKYQTSISLMISADLCLFLPVNLVSYSSPIGMKLGKFDLTDYDYDGKLNSDNAVLSGGLGKLVDGFSGSKDFHGWIGFGIKKVEISFQFSGPRRFSGTTLYTRTLARSAITVNIEISSSEDGASFVLAKNLSAVRIEPDGRQISVKMQIEKAKWLKFVFLQKPENFLLISEVIFKQGKYDIYLSILTNIRRDYWV